MSGNGEEDDLGFYPMEEPSYEPAQPQRRHQPPPQSNFRQLPPQGQTRTPPRRTRQLPPRRPQGYGGTGTGPQGYGGGQELQGLRDGGGRQQFPVQQQPQPQHQPQPNVYSGGGQGPVASVGDQHSSQMHRRAPRMYNPNEYLQRQGQAQPRGQGQPHGHQGQPHMHGHQVQPQPQQGREHSNDDWLRSTLTEVGVPSTAQTFMATAGAELIGDRAEMFTGRVKEAVDPGKFKSYFQVNNSYVRKKIQRILFSFFVKDWNRAMSIQTTFDSQGNQTSSHAFDFPKNDINSPDLYIPLMAFVTYVLLMGYIIAIDLDGGEDGDFTPEVLGATAGFSLFLLVIEVLCIKLCVYIIGTSSENTPSMLDLVSYSTYKYVSVVMNLLVFVIFTIVTGFGRTFYWLTTLVTSASMVYFIAKTFQKRLEDNHGQSNQKTKYFVVLLGFVQPIICILMENF